MRGDEGGGEKGAVSGVGHVIVARGGRWGLPHDEQLDEVDWVCWFGLR